MIGTRELEFQLFDHLDIGSVLGQGRFADHDGDSVRAILETATKLAEDKFASTAQIIDANEPTLESGRVRVPDEVKIALDAYREAGFFGAAFDYDDGGLQLPVMAVQAVQALFTAANTATCGYAFLTIAAAHMYTQYGTDEQKERFMRPLIDGRFFGTMVLSEPQAGSSLGDIRTRAEPQEDGTYKIIGNKMWISGADHELSENIVHHVLAKIPGGPPGVKGISLFIVPQYILDADG
ncbi:MAG: acyl-CoA dehydrogenase family protein, partial [Pseudomonadota bacterium]